MTYIKKSDLKQTLYTVCFLGLVIIDWTRGSQTGDIWGVAVNCTGLLFSVMLASHYSFRNVSFRPYLGFLLIWLLGGFAGYLWWLNAPGSVYLWQYLTGALNAGAIGLVLIRFLQDVPKKRESLESEKSGRGGRNLFLAAGLLLLTVLMLLSPLGNIWPAWFCMMFGLFYLIPYSGEERRKLWNGMANGIIIGFFVLQIYAFGFRPYDEVRYKGAYSNCNINSLFYLVTYIMVLYRLYVLKSRKHKAAGVMKNKNTGNVLIKVFYYVLAGGLLSFIFFTICRTAMLAAFLITFLYGIGTVLIIHREKIIGLFLHWLMITGCFILTFPCVYAAVRYLPGILHRPVWYESVGEYSPEKVHSFDPITSEKYVSLQEFLEEALGRMVYNQLFDRSGAGETEEMVIADIDYPQANFAETGVDAARDDILSDEASSGMIRKEIYRLYFTNLNLRGHELTEGYFQITESYHAHHAQNIFLQIAFYYGIPAGIIFLMLTAALGYLAFRNFLRFRNKAENIIPVLIWLVFILFGMLECVWYPGQIILFLMYFGQKITVKNNCIWQNKESVWKESVWNGETL